ncbi:MAG TPA: ABC transporter substrate-binding protein [Chloroflexia bacterium]|nr:ABC transporter substrate-binding protein [Chloroflexia bacterium]
MKRASDTRLLSRRGFLRLAGAAAGGLLAESALSAAPLAHAGGLPGPATSGAAGRVGVLLPVSNLYPELGRNFLSGLQLAGPLDLVVRECSAGANNPYAVACRLLEQEGITRLVGMIDSSALGALGDPLAAHRATALAVSLGENVVRRNKADARVTYHTLDLAAVAVAFGGWAARTLGRRAVLAASCYDSGYDAFAAFRLGFENAGGLVLQTAITHQPAGGPGLAAVMQDIAAARPDFVYAAYCGVAALEWMGAYQAAGLAGAIPLAGGPMLTNESWLAAAGDAALGIITAVPGPRDVAAVAAKAGAAPGHPGAPAELLALLGYETGRILTGQPLGGRPVVVRVVQRQDGGLVNTVRQTLNSPGDGDPVLVTLRQGLHTGWLHPYLGL